MHFHGDRPAIPTGALQPERLLAHRAQVVRKRWAATNPGVLRLEAEPGVNRKTEGTGLRQLERDGCWSGGGRAASASSSEPDGGRIARSIR